MLTACIFFFAMNSDTPHGVRCTKVQPQDLEKLKKACDSADKDPLQTCDALRSSDGSRWYFVYNQVN